MKKKVFQALICIVVFFQDCRCPMEKRFRHCAKRRRQGLRRRRCLTLGADQPQKKSVFLAVALSLTLPGMGELYAGNFNAGKYHLIAEGGIWLAYASLRLHSTWERQDAHSFAVEHAGRKF